MVGVSPKTNIRIRMYPVQYEGCQREQLTGNIKFASKVHLGQIQHSRCQGDCSIGGPIRLMYVQGRRHGDVFWGSVDIAC